MASLDDYRKQQIMDRAGVKPLVPDLMQQAQSPEMFSAKMPPLASKASSAPTASRPLAAAVGQKPITMPAGSAGWEAELTRMNNPGADVREPGHGSFWGRAKNALMYNSDVAAQQAKATPPAAKPPVAQDTSNYSNEGRNYQRPIVTSDASTRESQAQTPSNPLVRQIAPGIYRQGNSYGDSPEAAAGAVTGVSGGASQAMASPVQSASTPSGWTGRDNQIMAANIRDGVDPYRGTSQQQGSGAYIPEDTGGYGLLDKNTRETRNALVDMSQFKPGSGRALSALLQRQADAPNQAIERQKMAQQGQEAEADRGFRREELNARIGDANADRSLKAQELSDTMKTNDVNRQSAGVSLTAAQRMSALQGEYLNAETDAARDAAAKKLNALSGKNQPAEWGVQVTPGVKNIDGSTTEGSVYRFNKTTGEVQRVDGAQQAQLPPGMTRQVGTSGGKPVYEDANGKRFIGG